MSLAAYLCSITVYQFKLLLNYSLHYQKSNGLPLCSPPKKIPETAIIMHSYIVWLKREFGCLFVLNYSLHYQQLSQLPLCSPPQKIPEPATIVYSYVVWLKRELGCLFGLNYSLKYCSITVYITKSQAGYHCVALLKRSQSYHCALLYSMTKTWAWLPFCAQLQFKLLLNYSLHSQKIKPSTIV